MSRNGNAPAPPLGKRLRRRLLMAGGLLLAGWLMFFDSHSLLRRVSWHREHAQLAEENDMLRERITELETQIGNGLADETVERIAREQYGMRRPGETVYRIETAE